MLEDGISETTKKRTENIKAERKKENEKHLPITKKTSYSEISQHPDLHTEKILIITNKQKVIKRERNAKCEILRWNDWMWESVAVWA